MFPEKICSTVPAARTRPAALVLPPTTSVLKTLRITAAMILSVMLPLVCAGPASAAPIGNGPVVLVGYSGDQDVHGDAHDLALASLGWRWRWDGADCIDDFLARGHIDFSWSVEPLVGGVFGHSDAFEASVLPQVRFSPLGWEKVIPYFEAGIGLAYTGLRNYGLGSRVQFSDNVGIGVTFGSGEGRHWSIGYRYRHLSHAGIFDDQNEGLNAHFLAVAYE